MIKLLVVVVCCVAVAIQAVQSKHTMYGNVDVDEILKNEDLVNKYFACSMGTGSCTPEGESFKKLIPEALKDKCAKCSENDKEATEKVFTFLREKKPEMYKQIVAKYGSQESSKKLPSHV